METIFDHKTHFSYLKSRLTHRRGAKAQLAAYLRIQPAFLSQVLAEKYCLSLEQAEEANGYFDHATDEAHFFILLVSRDRAGTQGLHRHFDQQIQAVLKKRLSVVERLGRKVEISEEVKGIYYSSWLYAAAHVAATIPQLSTRRAMAECFDIPIEIMTKILDFLVEHQMLTKVDDSYRTNQNWVRLDRGSPHIVKHHTNWRQKAIQNFEVQTERDLHYSGVFSLDEKTALTIKDRTLEYLKQTVNTIDGVPEERLYVMGFDFFQLGKTPR